MVGIQGSGKSFIAEEFLVPHGYVVASNDKTGGREKTLKVLKKKSIALSVARPSMSTLQGRRQIAVRGEERGDRQHPRGGGDAQEVLGRGAEAPRRPVQVCKQQQQQKKKRKEGEKNGWVQFFFCFGRCFVMQTTPQHARHNNIFRELTSKGHVRIKEMLFHTYK